MMDFFENFIRLYSEEPIADTQRPKPQPPLKYADDIMALQGVYGDLNGLRLTIELQELLTICPRERRRIDAYRGLRSALDSEYNCILTVISRKTKE